MLFQTESEAIGYCRFFRNRSLDQFPSVLFSMYSSLLPSLKLAAKAPENRRLEYNGYLSLGFGTVFGGLLLFLLGGRVVILSLSRSSVQQNVFHSGKVNMETN